jgi:hypothetical protein
MLGAIGCGAEETQLGVTACGAELRDVAVRVAPSSAPNIRKPPFSLRVSSLLFSLTASHPPPPFGNRRRPAVRSGHPSRPAPATAVAFRRAAELARPARLPRQGRPPRARHRCSPPRGLLGLLGNGRPPRGLLATGRPPRPLRPRQLPPRPPRAPGPPTAAR